VAQKRGEGGVGGRPGVGYFPDNGDLCGAHVLSLTGAELDAPGDQLGRQAAARNGTGLAVRAVSDLEAALIEVLHPASARCAPRAGLGVWLQQEGTDRLRPPDPGPADPPLG